MESFIQHVLREMRVILGAPIAFFGAVAILVAAAWWAMDWRYTGVIANRDAEISSLQIQRDEYKNKLSGASPDQAAQRIAALELKVKDLEPRPQRHLTDAQRKKIVDAIKPLASDLQQIAVFTEAAREPAQLSVEFYKIFVDAGLNPVGPFISFPNYVSENGILIGLIDPEKPSDLAVKFMDVLRSANLEIHTTHGPGSMGKMDFDLFICDY
jgi:hypothetical protein